MELNLIVARNQDKIIAVNKEIPWYVPEDFEWFKEVTMKHALVMGRNTYDEIGKPLPGRLNIVLTSKPLELQKGLMTCSNLDEAITLAESLGYDKLFIIGGEKLYTENVEKVNKAYVNELYVKLETSERSIINRFDYDFTYDKGWEVGFVLTHTSKNGTPYKSIIYNNRNKE